MKAWGSRREFPPLLGNLVGKSYAEPLHNSNNAWQFLHGKHLVIAIAKSNITPSCINISLLPSTSPIRKFVKSLLDEVKASRLKKKVLKWFRNGHAKKFDYRFTGKEARLLSHNFMYLIHSLTSATDSHQNKLMLLSLAYCCVYVFPCECGQGCIS